MIRLQFAGPALLAALLPFAGQAQEALPAVREVITDAQFVHRNVAIPFLGDAVVRLYKYGDKFLFIPNPIAEWGSFNEAVDSTCSALQPSDQATVPLQILMYENSIFENLASAADVPRELVGIVPSYGYSIFYRIGNAPAVLLESTLGAQAVLSGEALAGDIPIPDTEQVLVRDTCEHLRDIGSRGQLLVSFHVQGRAFRASTFSAALAVRDTLNLDVEADQQEAQVDVVTIKNISSGGGLSVNLGPVRFGGGRAKNQMERSTTRYRTIDSDWVQQVVNRTMTSIDINRVCNEGACEADDVPALLERFLNTYVTEATAQVAQLADQSLQLSVEGIPGELEITVSEEAKAQLDLAWATSEKGEATIPIDGVPVSVKRDENSNLQIGSDMTWTRNGEQWIPTSFKLRLLNETDLLNQVNLSYSSTILGEGQAVSVQGGQADPFPRDTARDLVGATLSERVFALENRQLSCQSASASTTSSVHHVMAEARVPEDLWEHVLVTGGGCNINEATNNVQQYVRHSQISPDEHGWVCVSTYTPYLPGERILTATVIYCDVE